MSKKKRKKKVDRIPGLEASQVQFSNPDTGMARLFEFLDNCSVTSFPVSLKTASIISGMAEDVVVSILKSSLFYFVWKDKIETIKELRA